MKEYVALSNNLDHKNPFSLCRVGVTFADPEYYVAAKRRNTVEFVYIVAGKGTVVCNGRKYFLKAGDVFYLPIGCSFEQIADENDPWIKVWVNAFGSLVPNLMMFYNLEEFIHFPSAPAYNFFKKILKTCRDTTLTLEEKETVVLLTLHELIIKLHKMPSDNWLSSTSKYSDARIIKAYLDNHICDRVRMSDLTALIYKSESQAIRAFKKAYGITPVNYLTSIRITSAQRLLAETSLSVKEVAFRVGFPDEHYFSHLFKRKTGKSPTEYRDEAIVEK